MMGFGFVLPTNYIFFMNFRPRQYQNKLYASTFTGTGTAEFTVYRVHITVWQQDLLPWAYILDGLFRN